MAGNSSTEELTSELANIQAQLATKESDIVHLTSRLASAEQSHATALAESKSALDAANCATERLNTTVQDLQRERDTLSSSLASLETQLSAVTSSHSDELALSTSALEKAESLKLTLDSTILSLQQERDATATDLTRVNAALDSLRAEKDEADRLAPVHQQELVALEGALQQRDARITELETSAAAQTDAPTRSFDDSHVEAVEKRLAEAEERATDLSKQLGEMEEYESLRTEQQRELERKVEGLEQTIAELQEDLETLDNSSREELSRAGEDTDTARRLVEEAEIRIEHAETSLADREATIASLVEKNEQLESTIVDLELSTAHLPELEELLATASAELDTLRSTTEEGSLAAMQEASDLQARITTQESEIDDLKQHLSSLDTLRLTLTQEQDKVTALSQDLARAKEEASAVDISSANRLAALTTRAERAEEDVHRLRSKLDETTARLLDSKDLLAQSQADLQLVSSRDASPVPSPTTPTFSSNDASILVSRLREERDDLRTRLDFARTEAAYRVQALQERLKETEDAKAKEVSAMEVQLVERTAELGAEREGRIAAEEREQEAEKDVQALDDELARAEEKVREVEMRLDELTASVSFPRRPSCSSFADLPSYSSKPSSTKLITLWTPLLEKPSRFARLPRSHNAPSPKLLPECRSSRTLSRPANVRTTDPVLPLPSWLSCVLPCRRRLLSFKLGECLSSRKERAFADSPTSTASFVARRPSDATSRLSLSCRTASPIRTTMIMPTPPRLLLESLPPPSTLRSLPTPRPSSKRRSKFAQISRSSSISSRRISTRLVGSFCPAKLPRRKPSASCRLPWRPRACWTTSCGTSLPTWSRWKPPIMLFKPTTTVSCPATSSSTLPIKISKFASTLSNSPTRRPWTA